MDSQATNDLWKINITETQSFYEINSILLDRVCTLAYTFTFARTGGLHSSLNIHIPDTTQRFKSDCLKNFQHAKLYRLEKNTPNFYAVLGSTSYKLTDLDQQILRYLRLKTTFVWRLDEQFVRSSSFLHGDDKFQFILNSFAYCCNIISQHILACLANEWLIFQQMLCVGSQNKRMGKNKSKN